MKKISVEQFENEFKANSTAQCLDVREAVEYTQTHLENFRLCSLSDLSEKSVASLDKSKTTYLLCRSGNRACQAGDRLEKMNFSDVRVIEGGLGAWESSGRSVVKGTSKAWALERQVRFAAGFLVLLGLTLSTVMHPGWVLLSVFVAAGLIFSAVTDTCGMGMVLARMPWNRLKR